MLQEAYELSRKTISILERLNDEIQATIERERIERRAEATSWKMQLTAGADKFVTEQSERQQAVRELTRAQNRIDDIYHRLGLDLSVSAEFVNTRIDALQKIEAEQGCLKAETK